MTKSWFIFLGFLFLVPDFLVDRAFAACSEQSILNLMKEQQNINVELLKEIKEEIISSLKQEFNCQKPETRDEGPQIDGRPTPAPPPIPTQTDEKHVDCFGLKKAGINQSGIYKIYPKHISEEGITVLCDMETDGGGWTVILNRGTGDTHENFNRNWRDYKNGFGSPENEYWIGNEVIRQLTDNRTFNLQVKTEDYQGNVKLGNWGYFSVGDERIRYRLRVGDYKPDTSTLGDCLKSSQDSPFTTLDKVHIARIPDYLPDTYIGCFMNPSESTTLKGFQWESYTMAPGLCIEKCIKYGFTYAALQRGNTCFCGDEQLPSILKEPEHRCNINCFGDSTHTCGGQVTMSVYSTGIPKWGHLYHHGCFKQIHGLFRSFKQIKENMTPYLCIQLCIDEGYLHAGVQNGNECVCGNELPNSEAEVQVRKCSIKCAGDESYYCGGESFIYRVSFMNIYDTGLPPFTVPYKSYYQGCFTYREAESTFLNYGTYALMTTSLCIARCKSSFYEYAGILAGNKCLCSSEYPEEFKTEEENCMTKCPGDESVMCGGKDAMNIYLSSTLSPTSPYSRGCFTDNKARILKGNFFSKDIMAPDYCQARCGKEGYAYAGVQNGTDCFCGNELPAVFKTDDKECTTKCSGFEDGICGGPWRMTIFDARLPQKGPGYYLGCYAENASVFLMVNPMYFDDLTPSTCVENVCKTRGYLYAGLKNGNECLCSNERFPTKDTVPKDRCDRNCSGDSSLRCGGDGFIDVFHTELPKRAHGIYLGCYIDEGSRLLRTPKISDDGMDIYKCVQRCRDNGFIYAGVQNGKECRCGDEAPPPDFKTSDDRCSMPCSGYASFFCGGYGDLVDFYYTGLQRKCPVDRFRTGGWWYSNCPLCTPTAPARSHDNQSTMITWYHWNGSKIDYQPIKAVQFKIRPSE